MTNSTKKRLLPIGAELDTNPDVLFVPLDVNSFDPNGLEFDTQYFWRIVEVNDVNNPGSPWEGPVWDFTTANYIIVDDFEEYTNDAAAMQRVFQTWIDGLGYTEPEPGVAGNNTGAILGYDPAFGDIMEMTTVHGGSRTNPMKGAGLILLDHIEVGFTPMGLVAHCALENDVNDSSGNELHGVLGGDPDFPVSYVAGPAGFGQGMLFDGTGGHQNVELGTFNPSAATATRPAAAEHCR